MYKIGEIYRHHHEGMDALIKCMSKTIDDHYKFKFLTNGFLSSGDVMYVTRISTTITFEALDMDDIDGISTINDTFYYDGPNGIFEIT